MRIILAGIRWASFRTAILSDPPPSTEPELEIMVRQMGVEGPVGEAILGDQERKPSLTMACQNCSSEPIDLRVSPLSIDDVFGTSPSVSAQVRCLGGSFWTVNMADAIERVEGNCSVVEVVVAHDPFKGVDLFVADLKNPGATTLGVIFSNCEACIPYTIDKTLASSTLIQVTVRPKVTVMSADICADAIRTTLEPSTATGSFQLEYLTSGGTARTLVGPVSRSGGSYTDSFNVPAMVNGDRLRTIRATWTVNGVTGTGTRAYSIDVLGDYRITCYNTPRETDFSGTTFTACRANSQCQWSTRDWIAAFLSEVNENGSGVDRDNIEMQIEFFCSGAPTNCPPYNNRRYRHPGSLRTSCGNRPTVGTTVARNPNNTALACGSRVFIQGFGCRTVQDIGDPAIMQINQLDMYQGVGQAACAGWPNPTRKTIRIN